MNSVKTFRVNEELFAGAGLGSGMGEKRRVFNRIWHCSFDVMY
jgi:hypothetical protein